MSAYIQTDGYAVNRSAWEGERKLKGPQILSPYLMISSFVDSDNGKDGEYLVPGANDTSKKAQTCEDIGEIRPKTKTDLNKVNLKRTASFVAPVKLLNESIGRNAPCSSTEYSEKARTYDLADYIYSERLLLKMDTLDLYQGDKSELGQLASPDGEFYTLDGLPSPARGIPLKFRQIYFYGATTTEKPGGQSDPRWGVGKYSTAERTDGRGALFSMWVLAADPVNISCQYGNDPMSKLPGGAEEGTLEAAFSGPLTADQWAYDEPTQWFRTEDCQYHEGVGFNDSASSPTNPIVVGNGALGYNDINLGAVFHASNLLSPTFALSTVYYKTKVKVCIEDSEGTKTGIEGYIPFQPIESHKEPFFNTLSESDRETLPWVYDVRKPMIYVSDGGNGSVTASGTNMLNNIEQADVTNTEAPSIGDGTEGLDQVYDKAGISKRTVTGVQGIFNYSKMLYQPTVPHLGDPNPFACGE